MTLGFSCSNSWLILVLCNEVNSFAAMGGAATYLVARPLFAVWNYGFLFTLAASFWWHLASPTVDLGWDLFFKMREI